MGHLARVGDLSGLTSPETLEQIIMLENQEIEHAKTHQIKNFNLALDEEVRDQTSFSRRGDHLNQTFFQ